jgi:hypothetical protein
VAARHRFLAPFLLLFLTRSAAAEETSPSEEAAAVDTSPRREAPRRSGFTYELGYGAGYLGVAGLYRANDNALAQGASLAVGVFPIRDLALTFRIAGTKTNRFMQGFYGVAFQWYFHERGFLGGGIGAGLLADKQTGGGTWDTSRDLWGLAAQARIGWVLLANRKTQIAFTAEPTHTWFANDLQATGVVVAFGVQLF